MSKNDKSKKVFEIDLKEIDAMQDAIFEYFLIVSELMADKDIQVEKITLNYHSTKITVEGIEIPKDDEEETTDDDFEWI